MSYTTITIHAGSIFPVQITNFYWAPIKTRKLRRRDFPAVLKRIARLSKAWKKPVYGVIDENGMLEPIDGFSFAAEFIGASHNKGEKVHVCIDCPGIIKAKYNRRKSSIVLVS